MFNTKNYKLLLRKQNDELTNLISWHLSGFCDLDYAGDTETQRSISGYVMYVNGNPIVWKSKGQKSVTLSSTEAEYVALSEISGDILFLKSLVEFIGLEIQYPIKVMVDNIGAIF